MPIPYDRASFYRTNVAAARARGVAWCGAEMADELGILACKAANCS